jgi:hypothetical protein
MTKFLKNRAAAYGALSRKISGEDAAKVIVSSAFERDMPVFDQTEAGKWGLSPGQQVSVAPDDSGTNLLACSSYQRTN